MDLVYGDRVASFLMVFLPNTLGVVFGLLKFESVYLWKSYSGKKIQQVDEYFKSRSCSDVRIVFRPFLPRAPQVRAQYDFSK